MNPFSSCEESELSIMKKPSRIHWLLPAAFALPFAVAAAAVVALYGSDIVDLLLVALKMVVIA